MSLTNEKPFLVLTKRRTGGTSLVSLMTAVSSYPNLQHEPFNVDRVFGHISNAFRETGDRLAMRAAIEKGLENNPNIKHCYEIIPEAITEELIDICKSRGYAFFHLVRRDEGKRLRSLFLAQATGAWGDKDARRVYRELTDGERILEPVDLHRVNARYHADMRMQNWVAARLLEKEIDWTDLVFEDIYQRDDKIASRAQAILEKMGLTLQDDHPRLVEFAQHKGQNSASVIEFLPNHQEFEAFLKALK